MGLATFTPEQLKALPKDVRAQIEKLQQQAEAMAKAGEGKITLKVGDKGGISLYGMGRFPVTLYTEQWDRLLGWLGNGGVDTFRAFQAANKDVLKTKVDAAVERQAAAGNSK